MKQTSLQCCATSSTDNAWVGIIQMQDHMMQGGLTDLWLDDPYVLAAKKLIQWATEENEAGEVFPVSRLSPCPCWTCSYCTICSAEFELSGQCFQQACSGLSAIG